MKAILSVIVAFAISAGAAFAGCGMKDTNTGKLTNYDKDTKTITIQAEDGTSAMLTLTPDTQSKDAAGKAAKIEDLVGKTVEVVSEHNRVDSIAETKSA